MASNPYTRPVIAQPAAIHHLALLARRLYLQLNLATDRSRLAGHAIDQVKRQAHLKDNLQNL